MELFLHDTTSSLESPILKLSSNGFSSFLVGYLGLGVVALAAVEEGISALVVAPGTTLEDMEAEVSADAEDVEEESIAVDVFDGTVVVATVVDFCSVELGSPAD